MVLEIPGGFLFRSFRSVALFVPVYLAVSAALIMSADPSRPIYRLMNALILPFFTVALLLRLYHYSPTESAPILRAVISAFTLRGAMGFAALLLGAEAVALIRYSGAVLFGRKPRENVGGGPADADRPEEDADQESPDERASGGPFKLLEDLRGRFSEPAVARSLDLSEGDEPETDDEREEAPAFEEVFEAGGAGDPRDAGYELGTGDDRDAAYDRDELSVGDDRDAGYAAGSTLTIADLQRRLHRYDDAEVDSGDVSADALDADEAESLYAVTAGERPSPAEEALEDDDLDFEVVEVDLDNVDLQGEELEEQDEPREGSTFLFSSGRIMQTSEADLDEEPLIEAEEEAEPTAEGTTVPERKRPAKKLPPYEVPIDGLLEQYDEAPYWELDEETRRAAEVLRVTLEEFNIQAEVTGIRKGPVITMFEILPAPGVKLAKITNLSDNIALRLAASSVRIVAPIPGKHAVGIEIPNKRRNIVSFGELIREEEFSSPKHQIPVALGKDIPGDAQIVDLAKTPHLLIAGATGSGKSVCVNSIICSILYRRTPEEVKMILIDPKIVELKFYNDIPHLLTPVITDPKRAFQALQYCLYEMERRYSLLDSLQVRDVRSYNEKIKKRNLAAETLPYIVVVIDEFADLMSTTGKELESTVARLAAMSRAVGIHIVLATQRPSTDVITGLIKANIPSRVAFMVASKVDSRIIIDSMGAEKLLGKGDMLFTSAWDPFPFRMQGAYLSEEEVERVVEYVKTLGEPDYIDEEIFLEDDEDPYGQDDLEDPLMEQAIEIVTSANKASASYLQRRLKIGYNRAARLVEEMERIGIVGPQNGSKPREIIAP